MSSESYSVEPDSPIQSHANDGGVRVNTEFIKVGTSLPQAPELTNLDGPVQSDVTTSSHPEKDSPSDQLDHVPWATESTPQSDTQASQVDPQSVVAGEPSEGLPPHVWPLLASLENYPRDHRERMLMRLVSLMSGVWKERIDLWVKTHPIRSKLSQSHVPPITERGGEFYWVSRRERRKR